MKATYDPVLHKRVTPLPEPVRATTIAEAVAECRDRYLAATRDCLAPFLDGVRIVGKSCCNEFEVCGDVVPMMCVKLRDSEGAVHIEPYHENIFEWVRRTKTGPYWPDHSLLHAAAAKLENSGLADTRENRIYVKTLLVRERDVILYNYYVDRRVKFGLNWLPASTKPAGPEPGRARYYCEHEVTEILEPLCVPLFAWCDFDWVVAGQESNDGEPT